MSFKRGLSLSERKKLIEEILANYQKLSIQEIFKLYWDIFDYTTAVSISLIPNILFFRGIKYTNKPNYIHELSYPPPEFAKINRASDKGEQMFYAASNKKAVFYELDVQEGDRLVISSWINQSILKVLSIGYTQRNLKNLNSKSTNVHFEERNVTREDQVPYSDEENQYLIEHLAEVFVDQ